MPDAPQAEVSDRRFHLRGWFSHRATELIQALLADPVKVANDLEADLRNGGDAGKTSALLSVARVFGDVRGIDLTSRIREVSDKLRSAGFDVYC